MDPFKDYLTELVERDLAPGTRRAYSSIFKGYERWLAGRPPTPATLKSYLAHLRENGYRPGTVAQTAVTLKAFHVFLGQRDGVARIRVRRERRLPPYWDKGDLARLEAEAERMGLFAYAVIATLLYTGMRKGELLGLRVSDCDFRKKVIRVWGSKTGQERVIPMARRLLMSLWDLCHGKKGTDRVFPVSRGTIERIVARAARGAGLDGFTVHQCRHSFASRLLEAGATLEEIRQLLGHTDLRTLCIYLAASASGLRRAVDLLDSGIQVEGDAVAGESRYGRSGPL